MRTTLDIDDDVLQAANELSVRIHTTAGKLISDWARRGINSPVELPPLPEMVNGFEILLPGDRLITNEKVRQILDDDEDA